MAMKKLNFLMAFHCHQPVDNFGHVFREAYKKSYEPFLGVLERHPRVKVTLHYSGSLLDWLAREEPSFIKRVERLIRQKRIELMTGGYFEPVLSMVPKEDALGQAEMLNARIKKHFNYEPSGFWLAERVWDPPVKGIFKDMRLKYTILDDFHLTASGVRKDRVFGHYWVKDTDYFSVFASVKKLRYTMPFREPHVTVDFLRGVREKHGAESVTFADDGEKFGLWPFTYDWVYRKKWLHKFFTMIEKIEWLDTMTFGEALTATKPLGVLDIPHSSYAEMTEWSGGSFNNFFTKYPESGHMRERMLYVSRKLKEAERSASLHDKEKIESARSELYKAQSNCAYWHGVFGGVYLDYLRQGVFNHIIKAENILRGDSSADEIEEIDGDNVFARNGSLNLLVNGEYSGTLSEIDYKPLSYNLLNTMSRRYEPYHEKLTRRKKPDAESIKNRVDDDKSVDLYEVLGVKEKNLEKTLTYDPYRRFSLICRAMDPRTTFPAFLKSRREGLEKGLFLGPCERKIENNENRIIINLFSEANPEVKGRSLPMGLNKCIILEKDAGVFIRLQLENRSSEESEFIFGVEFNWAIRDRSFMKPRRFRQARRFKLKDMYCGIKVEHELNIPFALWSYPVYTLNESERGIGRNFQEVSLLFNRGLSLEAGEKFYSEFFFRIYK